MEAGSKEVSKYVYTLQVQPIVKYRVVFHISPFEKMKIKNRKNYGGSVWVAEAVWIKQVFCGP